jgi:transposase
MQEHTTARKYSRAFPYSRFTKQITASCYLISLHSVGLFSSLHIIEQIDHSSPRVTLRVRGTGPSASCPNCRTESHRIHSHYWRCLGDVPCFGRPVVLFVQIRRFRCLNDACPRRTFGERLPDVARPRARQTDRLRFLHQAIALALGAHPGARLASRTGMPVGATTLLRRLREVAPEPAPEPRVLGVDDWAWRKGSHYGTILCDLERGRRIDLLPDRTAETLAAWLKDHPSVDVIVRDRAGAYADGARQGAPQATQVADRWHLLRNGSDALRGILDHHHRHLDEAAQIAASVTIEPAANDNAPDANSCQEAEPPVTKAEQRSLDAQQRRDARFAAVARLREQGMTIRGIARALVLGRKTVRRWLRAGHAPTWRHADRGRSSLDPFHEYLETRWAAGYRNGTGLWREIRERGFAGQAGVVRQWAARRRRDEPPADRATPVQPPKARPPTARKAARLLMREPDQLGEGERRFVTALLDLSPPIAKAVDAAKAFSTMIKNGLADQLDDWIRAAEDSGFKGFAQSLRQDRDAVHAALTLPWSTGPVEGQINRLKVIKRTMYGRASFDLLRRRVLAAA